LAKQRSTRRDPMRTAAAGGLVVLGARSALGNAGRVFKVGLVGCGRRGSDAVRQHVEAARILHRALGSAIEVQVAATADYFKPKAERLGRSYGVPSPRCFGGADACAKLLATDVDTVLLATPPAFRPRHFQAAIEAGKHVFLEKPAAVDPPGCRAVIAAGEEARKKGLAVVAGTQRRHTKGYIDTQAAVAGGAIGRIVAGRIAWCQRHAGPPAAVGKLDVNAFIKSWRNWVALSGDHIVDQHVHNIDIANWFLGAHPVAAVGFGGRARRPAGDTYDFFSIDFEYPDGVHIHSMCRQIDDTHVWVGEELVGHKGTTVCRGGLRIEQPAVPPEIPQERRGHQQEHINMLYFLLKNKPPNMAQSLAEATATAIMGRTAAYTGQRIQWRDLMEDPARKPELYNLTLRPTAEEIEKGTAKLPKEGVAPVPGKTA
jgi:myo-inositol 2-dehydrogenase/D-chiro-inositol 1-dehydrogenase